MIPATEVAQRIARLFHRRENTHWSEKEVRQYKKLYKEGAFNNAQDMVLIEGYYAAERKKKEGGIHRRDLSTFLNNFMGELDRATAWSEEQHRTSRVKIDTQRKAQRPVSEAEWQRIGALARVELERFKQDFK